MKRIAVATAVAMLAAPAYAGFFQSTTTDPVTGKVTVTSHVTTPDFVYVAPPAPVFTTTVETRRKDNGNKVTITTTYRNGAAWSKERSVVQGGRGGGQGGKGKSSGR